MIDKFDSSDAKEYRDLCLKRIEEIDPDRNAGLAFSGGTDSITALFAMIETGRKPECYTFHMDGIISKDLQASRHACKYFGLKLHEIAVPRDVDSMYNDVKRVLPYCEHIKKTIIQCMIPWLYIYPAVEQPKIITGLGGDDFFATQRKLQVRYHQFGDEAILSDRIFYGHDLRFSGANIERFAKHYGIEYFDFYDSKTIEEFLLRYTFKAINKPYPKYASVAAFMDYYKKAPFYRDQTEHSYQTNSKLKDCQDMLLHSKYNTKGHKAIIGLYNQIAKEMHLI